MVRFNIDLIKVAIKEIGGGKIEFAQKCKISYSTLKKVLADNTSVRISTVIKIANFLNVKIENLIIREYSNERTNGLEK